MLEVLKTLYESSQNDLQAMEDKMEPTKLILSNIEIKNILLILVYSSDTCVRVVNNM